MEDKYNDATTQRPEGSRTLDARLVTIDVPSLIEQLRNETPWNTDDRNAITVFKTDGLRIVLIALHKSATMIEHITEGLTSIQVLEGQLLIEADKQAIELSKGQMLAMHVGVPHSLTAKEETILLLTLTTTLAKK
jgi:quercetin dioxygenase-like cupin family protein